MRRVFRWLWAGFVIFMTVVAAALSVVWSLSYGTRHALDAVVPPYRLYVASDSGRMRVRLQHPHGSGLNAYTDIALRASTHPYEPREQLPHERLGIGWMREEDYKTPSTLWTVAVPFAYLILVAAAVPAIPCFRLLRRRQCIRQRRCVTCGYDLRATPNQCPECGTISRRPPQWRARLREPWQRLRARPLLLAPAILLLFALGLAAEWAAQRAIDAVAWQKRAAYESGDDWITFSQFPNSASLRHLSRLGGHKKVWFWHRDKAEHSTISFDDDIPVTEDTHPEAFRGVALPNVESILLQRGLNADAWLQEFARPDTGLKNLKSLHFDSSTVTDAGIAELARPDSGLRSLTLLNLTGSRITDAGLAAMSRPDSGLRGLTSLWISQTRVTDVGLKALTRPDSGLKNLKILLLQSDRFVTDAGARELADPASGLKNIELLNLSETRITPTGCRELARPDMALASLTELDLESATDDNGLAALARSDGGLINLKSLRLYRCRVTDFSLATLARPDSGLKALTKLDLVATQVTYRGVASLRKARPALDLNLSPSANPP